MESLDLFDMSCDYSALFTEQPIDLFGDSDHNLEFMDFTEHDLQLEITSYETLPTTQPSPDAFLNAEYFPWHETAVKNLDIQPEVESFMEILGAKNLSPTSSEASSIQTTTKSRSLEHRRRCSKSKSNATTKATKSTSSDSVIVFAAQPNCKVSTRARKTFGPDRRKEVAMNRMVGACIPCKLRKGSCNFGAPCTHCISRAGGIALGQELCSRQRLLTSRFSNIDLLGVARFEQLLPRRPVLFPETQREVLIFWPNCCHQQSRKYIKVLVQDTIPPSSFSYADGQIDGWTQVLRHIRYRTCAESLHSDTPSLILDESMPPIAILLQSYTDSNHLCNSGPFALLNREISSFGTRYCDIKERLPLQDLMRLILKMKRLIRIYELAPQIHSTVDGDHWVPSSIKMQLRFHIAKEIMSVEAQVLHELDKLVYGSENIGKHNALALWACLWLLMLTYRSLFSTIHWLYRHDNAARNSLYGLATHMYHTLTSIYAALFKVTSPIIFDWRKEEIFEMLGRDIELVKTFCLIKTEVSYLYGERIHLFPEDDLLKTLVVENEFKLLESQKKLARRQGLL